MMAIKNKTKLVKAFFCLLFVLLTSTGTAQLQISNQGASTDSILAHFIGAGLTITNPVMNCTPNAYGTFSGGNAFGMSSGIALTTGNAAQLSNPANYFMSSSNNYDFSDPNLIALGPSASRDLCRFEFDMIPSCDELSIRFVFGSEEYPNYVNSSFNDAFGFFVSGPNPSGGNYTAKNIATINGSTYCSINNVNAGLNSQFYVNNNGGSTLPFGGYTIPITSSLSVTPCQTYHFKMAIADAADHVFDSGVFINFLQCSSTLSVAVQSTPVSCGQADATATAVVSNASGNVSYLWSPTPGGGQGTATATGLSGGIDYTVMVTDNSSCGNPASASVSIADVPAPSVSNSQLTQSICTGETMDAVVPTSNLGGTTFTWTTTSSSQNLTGFIPSGSGTIPVQTIQNNGNTTETLTFSIVPEHNGCIGQTSYYTLTVSPIISPEFDEVASICVGAVAPVLPLTSNNTPPISGHWSSLVSNASSDTYTFTPDNGQCSASTNLLISVNPIITPIFTAISPICEGTTAPLLPSLSNNSPAIAGSWSAPVSNTATAIYTFTPSAGQCATSTTLQQIVNPRIEPTFSVQNELCSGAQAPVLPTNSTNIPTITGSWSSLVSNTASGNYTFTPTSGQCASTSTINITVHATTTPTFATILPFCSGTPAPILPTSSTNNPPITGTWSAPVSNTTSASYIFTPTSGVCALTTTLNITVIPTVTPTFSAIAPFCSGTTAPILPSTSTNTPSISGTWSALVNNTASANYTFTPTAGQCALPANMYITVTPTITPTFTAIPAFCAGTPAPILPTNSTNSPSISGYWTSTINNTQSGTYTFIPTSGTCNTTASLSIVVNPIITPTFAAIPAICEGAVPPVLPLNSTNSPAITGTWSAPVSNTATDTYIFTPTAGLCAATKSITITVNPNVVPTFAAIPPICHGDLAPVLPTNSTNNPVITGTWSSLVSNSTSDSYTFNPTPGICATSTSLSVTVNPLITPLFDSIPSFCAGTPAPTLPVSSTNTPPISGFWSAPINNMLSASYTFTPTTGVCVLNATLDITVIAITVPTFDPLPAICQGEVAPLLADSSTNTPSLHGTWSSPINNLESAIYTFTPTSNTGECVSSAQLQMTVYPLPLADAGMDQEICEQTTIVLQGNSSATSFWTSDIQNNVPFTPEIGIHTYGLTVTDANGCSNTDSMQITVFQKTIPTFQAVDPICFGEPAPELQTSSTNIPALYGSWSPAVDVSQAGTKIYTFIPSAGQCADSQYIAITVNALPDFNIVHPEPACQPNTIDLSAPSVTAGQPGNYSYFINEDQSTVLENSNAIAQSGTYFVKNISPEGCTVIKPVDVLIAKAPIAVFSAVDQQLNILEASTSFFNNSIDATSFEWHFGDGLSSEEIDPSHTFPNEKENTYSVIMIAVSENGCRDTASLDIKISEQLIYYIPNTFTPDGNGLNDIFLPVFNAGYDPQEYTFLIFNRWGEVVFESHDAQHGWDGSYAGITATQDGNFAYKITYKETNNGRFQTVTGNLNLVR